MAMNKLPDARDLELLRTRMSTQFQIPSAYDDALSYQGLIYKLIQYLKDTMQNVEDWNDWLEDFVNTFDTRLQDNVREKIQEFYDSGKLAELTAQVMDIVQGQIDGLSGTVEELNSLQVTVAERLDNETDDSPRLQRAIDKCESLGIGVLHLKGSNYTIGQTLELPSNISIIGVSPIKTRLFLLEGVTAFNANAKKNIQIKDLAIDGIARAGTRAFTSSGESLNITFNNVWLDSLARGIETEYTYFTNLMGVRAMGTKIPFLFRNATNVVNMFNCSSVVPSGDGSEFSGYSITAFNGSCLNINGCAFEGSGGRMLAYSWSGLSIEATYFECQTALEGTAWVTLGNGVGNMVKGASIKGCNFLGGYKWGVALFSAEGVAIEGNNFYVNEAAIRMYMHDNSPKKDIKIGQNSYKAGIEIIYYDGSLLNDLNSNETQIQQNPLLFKKQNEPQKIHLENEDAVLFNRGNGVLGIKRKDNAGLNYVDTVMTGISGASTMFGGGTSKVVTHSLGRTPEIIMLTPAGDCGYMWVGNRNNTEFTMHCSKAPETNTTVYWAVK